MQTDETRKTLSVAALQDIDGGKPANAFNQMLRKAVADCHDREHDKRPRKCTMVVVLVPTPGDDDTGDIGVEFQMESKLPSLRSATYPMRSTSDGVGFFRPDSPFDPNQAPLPYAGINDGAEDDVAAAEDPAP